MCETCWKEDYGAVLNDSSEIQRAIPLIHCIWDDNEVSMPLHVQIDDWNVDGDWKPWPDHRAHVSEECWKAAVELSALMNSMSVEDRASALARASNYALSNGSDN